MASLQCEHTITVLGRDRVNLKHHFAKPIPKITWEMLPDLGAKTFDTVINLCGQNIASSRWNNAVKKQLISSRVNTTVSLIDWAMKDHATPILYVQTL